MPWLFLLVAPAALPDGLELAELEAVLLPEGLAVLAAVAAEPHQPALLVN